MLEKQFTVLATWQERYPIAILSVMFVLTAFFFYHAISLGTDSSFDTLYGPNSDHVQLKNLVSNEFDSTDDMYILVIIDEESNEESRIQDIRHPEVLHAMERLSQSVLEERTVTSVFSIVDALYQQYGRLPDSLDESKEFFDGFDNDISALVSSDYSALNMLVEMNIGSKPGAVEEAETAVQTRIDNAAKPVGIKVTLTGEVTLINQIMNLLINDNMKTVAIAMAFIAIILSIYFRSPSIGIVALAPVVITLIWLAGTLSLLDIRITMMTAAVGAMLVGMGIDYSIHLTHGYVHNLRRGAPHPAEIAIPKVGGALLASSTTTFFGFIAMLFGASPGSKTQGFALSVGIAYAFIVTMLVLPCLLVLHRKIVFSDLDNVIFKLDVASTDHSKNFFVKMLEKLSNLQVKRPFVVVVSMVVLLVVIVPGMGLVRLDTSNDNWLPEDDPVLEALDEVGLKFGGLSSQSFLVMTDPDSEDQDRITDLRDPKVLKSVANVDRVLEDHDFIDRFNAPTDEIISMNGKIPQDIEEVKNLIEQNPQIASSYNKDFTILKLSAQGDSFESDSISSEENYREWLNEINSVSFPEGVMVIGQGGIRSNMELDALLAQDTVKTTGIGFLFVFIVTLLFYRSFVVSLLAIIPIILSLLLTVGIMGYIDLPFTVLTGGMMAIVMGMGIDFSLHLIHNARRLLDEGRSIEEAITTAVTETGEAISVATLTTMVGFSSLVLATLLGTQRLGYTLAIAIFAAFTICMLLVPSILVLEHKLKKRKSLPTEK